MFRSQQDKKMIEKDDRKGSRNLLAHRVKNIIRMTWP